MAKKRRIIRRKILKRRVVKRRVLRPRPKASRKVRRIPATRRKKVVRIKPASRQQRKLSEKANRLRYEQLRRERKREGEEFINPLNPELANLPSTHGPIKYDLCNPAERERLWNQIASDTLGMQDRLSQYRDPSLSQAIRYVIHFSGANVVEATKMFRSIDTLHAFLVVDTRSPSITLNTPDWSEEGLCGYEKTITMGVAKFGKIEAMTSEQIGALTEEERHIVETKAGFRGFDHRYPVITYLGAQPGEFDDLEE